MEAVERREKWERHQIVPPFERYREKLEQLGVCFHYMAIGIDETSYFRHNAPPEHLINLM